MDKKAIYFMGPFLWITLNRLERYRTTTRESLLLITKSPGVPKSCGGPRQMKGWEREHKSQEAEKGSTSLRERDYFPLFNFD